MKNKSKLAVGLFLVLGLIVVTTIVTNIYAVPPIEDGGDDPGNGPGPGIYLRIPTETEFYKYENNQLFLIFETPSSEI